MIHDEPLLVPVAMAQVLVGTPFLALALRRARRLVPAVPGVPTRWRLAEALLALGAPFAVFALAAIALREPGPLAMLLTNQLALGAGAAVAVAFVARRPMGMWSLGLETRPSGEALGAVALTMLPLFLLVLGLGGLWRWVCHERGWEETQEVMGMLLEMRGGELALAAFMAVVLGPLVEELFFRGFLLSALAQAAGERRALWYVSGLFAVLHGVAALPMVFALALFLGWLQQRSRCLLLPLLAHMIFNGGMLGLALALGAG